MKHYSFEEWAKLIIPTITYDVLTESFQEKLITWLESEYQGDGMRVDRYNFIDIDEDNQCTWKDYVARVIDEVWLRYYDYFAFSVFNDNEINDEVKKFLVKFLNVLNNTYPRYSLLIKAQEDHKTKLMDGLTRHYKDEGESEGGSTSRFNDTPQNDGEFDDETHNTTVTKATANNESSLEHTEETDNKYVYEKLSELENNLTNLYLKWANEIGKILYMRW